MVSGRPTVSEGSLAGMDPRVVGRYEENVHLQVHWPVGQAQELPQLQVHPGPS